MKNYKYCVRTFALHTAAVFALGLSSCRDFLNVDGYFDDQLKLDSVFAVTRYVEAYMWGATRLFHGEHTVTRQGYTPGTMATDEGFVSHGTGEYQGMGYVLDQYSPDNMGRFGDLWKNMYKIIRKCNTIIMRIDQAQDMTLAERMRIMGYTRFFRAYAYYHLLVNFGPPILLGDNVVETNEAMEYYDRARATFDEAMEYVCSELEEAARTMPLNVPFTDFGLPTKGAAYGLVARLRLMHASPLYNGGSAARIAFGSWTRKTDGKPYVNLQYDERRWALAAAAARRVMEMTDKGQPLYSLYTVPADDATPALPAGVTSDPDYYLDYPAGANGIDPYRSYSELFNGEAVLTTNPEFVWGKRAGALNDDNRRVYPVSNGGYNHISVTQKVVDAYLMDDGRTREEAVADGYYSETGFTPTVKNFSGYRLNANVYKMYDNREARFYASTGFSECFWPSISAQGTGGATNITVTYYIDGNNGKMSSTDPLNYPLTGYVYKKIVHPQDSWQGNSNASRTTKGFGIVRYAEILLAYAEAVNNLTAPHTVEMDGVTYTLTRDAAEIKRGFNPVRYRAGLPGLSVSRLNDPAEVQKQIERERMVELLFEGHRYFDVRRWGIYEQTEQEPVTGMNVEATKDGFYQRVVPNSSRIGQRVVNRKLLLLPIPRNEIKRLPSLDQNPGW